jgi:AbrB family looped-hinge helix DNA binding protein
MASNMEETANVDRQGRLVIPSPIRDSLGLKEGGKVTLRLDGPRLILEPALDELQKRVAAWEDRTLRTRADPYVEPPGESWKWMSREYAKRKLGL